MKEITKIRLLNFFNLFNRARDILYRNELRQTKVLDFYGSFISPGNVCYDIGANIGRKTDIFLHLGAKVVVVEPQPECAGFLEKKYGGNPNVTLIRKAIGENVGTGQMLVCEANALSSLSDDWINKVKQSGRYKDYVWNDPVAVDITTLDKLIDIYGRPNYCKIDVEGYEYKVLLGLSKPPSMLSFEISPETPGIAEKSIDRLLELGNPRFNFSLPESYSFVFDDYIPRGEMLLYLKENNLLYGDIYARFDQ